MIPNQLHFGNSTHLLVHCSHSYTHHPVTYKKYSICFFSWMALCCLPKNINICFSLTRCSKSGEISELSCQVFVEGAYRYGMEFQNPCMLDSVFCLTLSYCTLQKNFYRTFSLQTHSGRITHKGISFKQPNLQMESWEKFTPYFPHHVTNKPHLIRSRAIAASGRTLHQELQQCRDKFIFIDYSGH